MNPPQPTVVLLLIGNRRELHSVLDIGPSLSLGSGEFHDVPAAHLRLRTLHSRTTSALCLVVHRCGGDPRAHSRVRALRNEISCAAELLSHLKTLAANTESDEFLRELLTARPLDPNFIESVLILAFLPTAARRRFDAWKATTGSFDRRTSPSRRSAFCCNICAPTNSSTRQSHFAFAISRAVKRKIFEWAQRESRGNGTVAPRSRVSDALAEDDSFERHLLLRHFLHRCVTKRLITDSELNLLIDFKLDGGSLDSENGSNGNSTNAIRQKLKRLLRKLRRIASER